MADAMTVDSILMRADRSRLHRASVWGVREQVDRLLAAGEHGLPWAYDWKSGDIAQTLRRDISRSQVAPAREGSNLRYAAMAALGINRLEVADQRAVLAGSTAAALASRVQNLAFHHSDPGVVALSAWASSEVSGRFAGSLFRELNIVLTDEQPIDTVSLSWMLTAATVARCQGESAAVAERAVARLIEAQGPHGIFPHIVPVDAQNRWRRHVGSFADQVYPIQALARMYVVTGDRAVLDAAEATAAKICELQGMAGQWWWHYDVRTGQVVERFPVYSVHQHAMAPMVLFDLAEAGGTDHVERIVAGVRWLDAHPEVNEDLVVDEPGVVWRKVGRREPAKAVRKISAVTTAVRAGLHVPGLDRAFPPNLVDHECRPYEMGWLLYAWLPARMGNYHE